MIHGLEEELRVSRAILDGKFDKKPTTYEECEALVDALRNPEGAASEAPASEAPPAVQNCSECKKECGERLLTCAQCKRAHYCGKACQVKAWRTGHRRVCQPATRFRQGQRCRIKGLSSSAELNGQVVIVQGPSGLPGGERWSVKTIDEKPRTLAVRPANLMHYWCPSETTAPAAPERISREEALRRLEVLKDVIPERDRAAAAARFPGAPAQ